MSWTRAHVTSKSLIKSGVHNDFLTEKKIIYTSFFHFSCQKRGRCTIFWKECIQWKRAFSRLSFLWKHWLRAYVSSLLNCPCYCRHRDEMIINFDIWVCLPFQITLRQLPLAILETVIWHVFHAKYVFCLLHLYYFSKKISRTKILPFPFLSLCIQTGTLPALSWFLGQCFLTVPILLSVFCANV